LFDKPCATLWTEQVGCRAGWDKLGMQDRLHHVLQSRFRIASATGEPAEQ